MLTRTEGIVLKTQEYTEADLIVTYLTLSKGIVKAFAKSPRKTKSRFGSSLEPLTHSKIALWGKEQSMPKITQSDIISSFHSIRENFYDFANISKLAEILISLMPEGIPNKKLFLFFLNILGILGTFKEEQKSVLHIVAQIRLLSTLGYAPRLKDCGKCGAKSPDFYPDSGTILCKKCAIARLSKSAPFVRVTKRAVQFYSHGIEWPLKASTRLKPAQDTVSELSAVLDKHLTYLFNKKLLTSEFLARV